MNENGVVLQGMEDEPMCKTCKKSVRVKSENTSTFLAHLCDHHADLYVEASKSIQSKGESSKPSLHDTLERSVHRFPLLSVLVKQYLCICGSSVPSECANSSSGYIVDPHHARLLPSNVNMLMFLSKNMP